MNTKHTRIISYISIIVITFCSIFPTHISAEHTINLKIDMDFIESLGVSYEDLISHNFEESNTLYPCVIWISDINLEEAVQYGINAANETQPASAKSKSYVFDYSVSYIGEQQIIDVNFSDDASDVYVQTYIENERAAAKSLYQINNNNFLSNFFNQRTSRNCYTSSYSPCIFADLTISDISALLALDEVTRIDYWEYDCDDNTTVITDLTAAEKQDLNSQLDIVKINSAKIQYQVTGNGIKIGQIETYCPTKNSVTKPANVGTSGHADAVHTIMSTVAPGAKFYANDLNKKDLYQQIEWLLDQGVNIINMSYGESYGYNVYNPIARWIDHISYNHDVHFVVASGNYKKDFRECVTGAAMAYNAITVGNTYMTGNLSINETSLYNSLGASRSDERTYKPDLCAPGTFQSSSRSGTSYSTPLVTGTIALLCEYQPSLKTKQHIVKAILAVSTGKDTRRYKTTDTNFKQYGAGILDAKAALWIISQARYSTTTGTVSGSSPTKTYTMTVTSSDTVMRIALAYANRIKFTSSEHGSETPEGSIGELQLTVSSPSGKTYSCTVDGANLKIVQFNVTEYGVYTIQVKQTVSASNGRATNFGVAWR